MLMQLYQRINKRLTKPTNFYVTFLKKTFVLKFAFHCPLYGNYIESDRYYCLGFPHYVWTVGRCECGRMSHEDGGDLLWLSTRAWINMYWGWWAVRKLVRRASRCVATLPFLFSGNVRPMDGRFIDLRCLYWDDRQCTLHNPRLFASFYWDHMICTNQQFCFMCPSN